MSEEEELSEEMFDRYVREHTYVSDLVEGVVSYKRMPRRTCKR